MRWMSFCNKWTYFARIYFQTFRNANRPFFFFQVSPTQNSIGIISSRILFLSAYIFLLLILFEHDMNIFIQSCSFEMCRLLSEKLFFAIFRMCAINQFEPFLITPSIRPFVVCHKIPKYADSVILEISLGLPFPQKNRKKKKSPASLTHWKLNLFKFQM